MKLIYTSFIFLISLLVCAPSFGQVEEQKVVDIVWLKDGSKLTGTIMKWELERGMEFKLLTGAEIMIPKKDIHKVMQDIDQGDSSGDGQPKHSFVRAVRPYAFKEKGWYQNSSGFVNISFYSGAGIHHAMGYRFNRKLGIGMGLGIESNDFSTTRNIVPVYAEARGFLLPKKITPYYALKLGYGFALKDESRFVTDASGGLYVSPEIGVRFGGEISYYLGLEYKLQNASFTSDGFDFGGAKITEKISYRRLELRTGLLF